MVATAAGIKCDTTDDAPIPILVPTPRGIESNAGGLALEDDLVPVPPSPGKLLVADVSELPLSSYVVSVQRRGRFKRLHRLGGCALRPDVDYHDYELLGSIEPPTSAFSAKCKRCFGDAAETAMDQSFDKSSSSGSPSSGASIMSS